jgi:hypothetical protein
LEYCRETRHLLGHVYAKEMRTGAFRARDLITALPGSAPRFASPSLGYG